MSENTFYQWPSCTNCESVFPRAVLIQRICNLAGFDMKVTHVLLPREGEGFQAELEKRLKILPYLEMNGQKFRSSRQIWDHLISTTDTNVKLRLTRIDSIYSFIIQQWCNESFINSLVYARWKKEDNYQKFIRGVNFGTRGTPEALNMLRGYVLKYLSRSPIAELNQEEFQKLLTQQIASLATIIEEQTYFETFAKHPTLTDLNVFMVVQGFLSSDLEESSWIEQTYPALIRWYKNMETLTQKNHPTIIFSDL